VTENLQSIPLARDGEFASVRKSREEPASTLRPAFIQRVLAKSPDHASLMQYVITPEMGPAFVENLPVAKFHGIGPATSTKMILSCCNNGLGHAQ